MKGKLTRESILKATGPRLGRIIFRRVRSREGHHYVNRYRRKIEIHQDRLYRAQSDVLDALKMIFAEMGTNTGKSVKSLRTDGGGEYMSLMNVNSRDLNCTSITNPKVLPTRKRTQQLPEDGFSERKDRTFNDKARPPTHDTARHTVLLRPRVHAKFL